MTKMSYYQEKLWNYYLNKGILVDYSGDEQRFLRNYPTDALAKRAYEETNPKKVMLKYLDNDGMVQSTEMYRKKSGKKSIKKCHRKKSKKNNSR